MFDGCCVMLCFVRIHKTSPRTNGDAQPSFCQFSPTEPRRCVTLCECILLVVMSVSDIKLCERTQSKLFLLRTRSQDGKRKTSGCPGREHATFRKAQSGFESSLAPFAAWHPPRLSPAIWMPVYIFMYSKKEEHDNKRFHIKGFDYLKSNNRPKMIEVSLLFSVSVAISLLDSTIIVPLCEGAARFLTWWEHCFPESLPLPSRKRCILGWHVRC